MSVSCLTPASQPLATHHAANLWAACALREAPTAPLHRPQLQGEPTLLLHEERAIRMNSWFRQLDAVLQRAVLGACSVRRVRAGTVLLRSGPVQAWYGVAQGVVKVSTPLETGRRLTVALLRPGQWFGEEAVFDPNAQLEAVAYTDVTLIWMPRTTLMTLVDQHARLGLALGQLTMHRTRWLTAQLASAVSMSLRQRLAHLLRLIGRDFGDLRPEGTRLWLRLSQRDLSDMLGVCRQRINVCLKQMEREQVLCTQNGHLILQMEALRAVAEAPSE